MRSSGDDIRGGLGYRDACRSIAGRGFRTRGWAAVSVQNQHLDLWGVIIAPDLFRLEQLIDVYGSAFFKIGPTYYLTYTAYNRRDAQLCLATSTDLIHWDRKGILLPAYKGSWNTQWTKSGAIIPWKMQGKWWMYYLGTRVDPDGKSRDYMGVATSQDLLHWTDATDKPVLPRREGAFDCRVMEPGPTPIRTKAGILLLYNGATEDLVYEWGRHAKQW